jgi:hypothetical protein
MTKEEKERNDELFEILINMMPGGVFDMSQHQFNRIFKENKEYDIYVERNRKTRL